MTFTNNDVSVADGSGQLMTHWSNADARQYRIRELKVTGNTFVGVSNQQTLTTHMQNVGSRRIQRNTFLR